MLEYETSNFTLLGENVGIIQGQINEYELIQLNSFVGCALIDREKRVLLIDSTGGLADFELLAKMVKAPIHTHVLKRAESFGAALFLMGSYKTMEEDSIFMLHKPKWDEHYLSVSIHQDEEILKNHMKSTINIFSSVLPCSEAKSEILQAYLENKDTFFNIEYLYEQHVIDEISPLNFEGLDLWDGNLKWLKRNYK